MIGRAGIGLSGDAAHASSNTLKLDDDIQLQFGTDVDYWHVYNNSGTQYQFRSTDVDGAGADGTIWDVQDGTNDVRFVGGIGVDNQAAPTSGIHLTGDIDFQGAASLTTTSGDITLSPASELNITTISRISAAMVWSSAPLLADDILFRYGGDTDVVALLRSTTLAADVELTTVIEGTSVHQGVAANSFIGSNITNDGDYMLLVSDGGNSLEFLKADADVAALRLAHGFTTFEIGLGGTLRSSYTAGAWAFQEATTISSTSVLTIASPVLTTPQINDTSADHQYVFGVSELVADRTVTLPLLTGDATFAFVDFVQTFSAAQTFSGALNISGTQGIDCNPGSDIDTDIITVGVTTTPRIFWDESLNSFVFTQAIVLDVLLLMFDDKDIRFGSNSDYRMAYNSAGTYFRFRTSDSDGGGTDADVYRITDGTDDVQFLGGISTDGVAAPTTGIQTPQIATVSGDLTLNPAADVQMGADVFIEHDTNAGLTASTTQTQGQGALTTEVNEVATVANTDDTVTLPVAAAGRMVTIINNGANDLQIFPASGDNLGAGVDNATSLEFNETVTFVAYDATNWKVEFSTQLLHAEMTDNDNTDAYVVSAQSDHHAYHTNGLVAGDLGGGWAFDAGGAGTSHAIASIADGVASGVDIEVTTSDNHLLAVNDIVSQTNLTSAVYTGHFKVKAIISDTEYEVAAVFTATDTGTMDQAAVLICPIGGTGTYKCDWGIDGTTAANNDVIDFAFHLDGVHQNKSNGRNKFGTAGDVQSVSRSCLLDITEGDRVSWMVLNTSGSGNITIRHINVVLIRL